MLYSNISAEYTQYPSCMMAGLIGPSVVAVISLLSQLTLVFNISMCEQHVPVVCSFPLSPLLRFHCFRKSSIAHLTFPRGNSRGIYFYRDS